MLEEVQRKEEEKQTAQLKFKSCPQEGGWARLEEGKKQKQKQQKAMNTAFL